MNPQPQLTPLPANDGNVWLRLTKTGTDYKGEYSFDGTTFTAFGDGHRTRWPSRASACSRSA